MTPPFFIAKSMGYRAGLGPAGGLGAGALNPSRDPFRRCFEQARVAALVLRAAEGTRDSPRIFKPKKHTRTLGNSARP